MAGPLDPGQVLTSFDPLFFWQPLNGKLPDTDRESYDEGAWTDQGWRQILDTVNGAAATKRNPTVAVTGDRLGRVGSRASGDDGVAIALQLLYPEMDLMQTISSMSKAVQAASSEVVTLTVQAVASPAQAGNYPIILDGTRHEVPLAATDNTPALVAAKVRGFAFPGWTTGGSDGTVTFTAAAAGRKGPAEITAGHLGVTARIEKTVLGYNAKNSRAVDKRARTQFMIGFEGVAEAGGMFPVDTHVMAVAYAAENTGNTEWVWRETGLDALLRPSLTLEALPAPFSNAQLEDSGVSRALIDRNRKFNYFDEPVAA